MKKWIGLVVALAVLTVNPASAEEATKEATKWFFGAGYIKTEIETGITGLTGTATLDEKDDGFRVFGGYQLNPYVGFELSYADFGTATLKASNGDSFVLDGTTINVGVPSAQVDLDVWSINLGGVFSLPLEKVTGQEYMKYVTPYAKLGGFYWDAEATVNNSFTTVDASDDGFDLYFGAGLQINFHKTFAISGEWMRYNADGDIDTYGANLIIRF